jgi:hypothetical protein
LPNPENVYTVIDDTVIDVWELMGSHSAFNTARFLQNGANVRRFVAVGTPVMVGGFDLLGYLVVRSSYARIAWTGCFV